MSHLAYLKHSTLLLPVGASRDEWLKTRTRGLGASDMSKVAGVGFGNAFELWLEKTGQAPEKKTTRRMTMGNLLEPFLLQFYGEDTGNKVTRVGLLESKTHPLFRCTPDGWVNALDRLFEAKTTNWHLKQEWADGQVADHAEIQVQMGMFVTGAQSADVGMVMDGNPDSFTITLVDRDQHLIDTLIEMGERFWRDHVETLTPPPVDGRMLDTLKAFYDEVTTSEVAADPDVVVPLLEEFRRARDMVKATETAKKDIEAKLIQLIGNAEAVTVDGETAFTYKQVTTSRTDTKAIFESHPELDPSDYKTQSTYRRLSIPAA